MNFSRMLTTCVFIFFNLSSNAAEEIFFVRCPTAPLREAPGPAAKIIRELSQGAQITKLKSEGIWAQVKDKQSSGWVSQLMIGQTPPLNSKSLLETSSVIGKDARKRASANTTAGAARGLLAEKDETVVKLPEANYQSLKKMMSYYIPPQSVKSFKP